MRGTIFFNIFVLNKMFCTFAFASSISLWSFSLRSFLSIFNSPNFSLNCWTSEISLWNEVNLFSPSPFALRLNLNFSSRIAFWIVWKWYLFSNDGFNLFAVFGLFCLVNCDIRLGNDLWLLGKWWNNSVFINDLSVVFIFVLALRAGTLLSGLAFLVRLFIKHKILSYLLIACGAGTWGSASIIMINLINVDSVTNVGSFSKIFQLKSYHNLHVPPKNFKLFF